MFKKFNVGVLVAVLLVLGVGGVVFAQDPTPPVEGFCPYGGTCGGYGMGGFGYRGTMSTLLSDALGMAPEDLYAALADGQTIAELAEAQGVGLDDVVEALVAPRIEQLEHAVADSFMTQEQADWMIEMMTTQMSWRIENFGLGYGGYGGGGGCGMMGGGYRDGRSSGRWGGSTRTRPSFPTRTFPSADL